MKAFRRGASRESRKLGTAGAECLHLGSHWALLLADTMAEGVGRVLLGLLLIPAILFVAWSVVQYSREADEFARRQLTESLAIGFAFGSALVASYGLLDSFGAPPLSWMFAFAAYMMCWAIGSAVVAMRYRS